MSWVEPNNLNNRLNFLSQENHVKLIFHHIMLASITQCRRRRRFLASRQWSENLMIHWIYPQKFLLIPNRLHAHESAERIFKYLIRISSTFLLCGGDFETEIVDAKTSKVERVKDWWCGTKKDKENQRFCHFQLPSVFSTLKLNILQPSNVSAPLKDEMKLFWLHVILSDLSRRKRMWKR